MWKESGDFELSPMLICLPEISEMQVTLKKAQSIPFTFRVYESLFDMALGHTAVVAAYNLGVGANFWKLFLALIGSCRLNKYCHVTNKSHE